MKHLCWIAFLVLTYANTAYGEDNHHHAVPTLKNQGKTVVTVEENTVTLTFGPIDLPVGHAGELAASMPMHYFQLPRDMYMVSFKSHVFTQDGVTLPIKYLHHILLVNTAKESVSCQGAPLFFAGAGLQMVNTRFPPGYGEKLEKGGGQHRVLQQVRRAGTRSDGRRDTNQPRCHGPVRAAEIPHGWVRQVRVPAWSR